jgi:hypothetical protein
MLDKMIDEQRELEDKITRLRNVLVDPIFPQLPEREQDRLREQLHYMLGYNTVLKQRIEAFT